MEESSVLGFLPWVILGVLLLAAGIILICVLAKKKRSGGNLPTSAALAAVTAAGRFPELGYVCVAEVSGDRITVSYKGAVGDEYIAGLSQEYNSPVIRYGANGVSILAGRTLTKAETDNMNIALLEAMGSGYCCRKVEDENGGHNCIIRNQIG
ncbi:MAG: hypothetical protein ACI4KM_03785 [Oscillospiraceae bacterium]